MKHGKIRNSVPSRQMLAKICFYFWRIVSWNKLCIVPNYMHTTVYVYRKTLWVHAKRPINTHNSRIAECVVCSAATAKLSHRTRTQNILSCRWLIQMPFQVRTTMRWQTYIWYNFATARARFCVWVVANTLTLPSPPANTRRWRLQLHCNWCAPQIHAAGANHVCVDLSRFPATPRCRPKQ